MAEQGSDMIFFLYGAGRTFIDVTSDVLNKCRYGSRIHIPAGDTGATIFPDPLPGVAKEILVVRQTDGALTAQLYGPNEPVGVLLPGAADAKSIVPPPASFTPEEKLDFYHSQLDFAGGDLNWERIEQLNTAEFLDPDAKVLELGSGCGTNTMMISCILNDESNLVTLECSLDGVEMVRRNRAANNFRFHVENAALSYRKLMYNRELMLTVPGDELKDGYEWINTVTLEEIKEKYGIDFDTLVADCEGALYYILQDNEHMLDGIKTVILESDYRFAEQKWAVEAIFGKYGLRKVKHWSLANGGEDLPQECRDSFWEVWKS